MRVSTNMLTYNFMSSLNKSLQRQNELQEKLSDGKAIHRPSDDPVKTIRSLRFNINLKENEQYTQHVKDATSWMETTDGAMSDLSSLTIKAKELVVKSVSANPDIAMDAIAEELDGIINQMVQIGNTKIGDRYIFAGQNDKTQPFQRRMVDPGTAGGGDAYETVVYMGDSNKISMRIQPGSITASQDSVNLTGEDVFGLNTVLENGKPEPIQTATILDNLIRIKEALSGKVKKGETAGAPTAQSNPIGGAASQTAGGTHNAFTLRIDGLDTTDPSKVTEASYSTDGGVTWEAAVLDGGAFVIPQTKMGTTENVKYTIANDGDNRVGDIYTLPKATTTRDTSWLSKTGLYLVDSAHNYMLQSHTELGARMSMYEQAQALLEKNNVIITGDVSANEDLDIAQAMIDFKTSESVYRTALSVGAKLMPPSLADFLN